MSKTVVCEEYQGDDIQDRAIGALVGLAAGDALGTTLEFANRDKYPPVTDIIGLGPFQLKPGQWTDDTSMALCLAESLIKCQGMDLNDQLDRYTRWVEEGYHSSTGKCFDIGQQTLYAIGYYKRLGELPPMPKHRGDGNGSLMRLAPVPIFFHDDAAVAAREAARSSITTHPTQLCQDACAAYAQLIVAAIQGKTKAEIIELCLDLAGQYEHPELQKVLGGSFKLKDRDAISSSGYVIHTLEAALWAFWNTNEFREGAILAVNLGDDADTVGAVYGQLAGAYYGKSGIPSQWVQVLWESETIIEMAETLIF